MALEEDLQKALEAKNKGDQELMALKERVAKGESLGDPIKDYLFVCYGTTEFPVVEEQLKSLSDKIKDHNGQQVMVLYTKQEVIREGDGGCFGGGDWTRLVVKGQQLGVLNGELRFNLSNGSIVLPTNKYAQKGGDLHIWEVDRHLWELKEGDIAIPGYHYGPNYLFEERNRLARQEILVSDEVELYFSTEISFFEQYLSSRSNDWKEHLLKEKSVRNMNGNYLDALNLLGLSAPERFQQKYDAKVEQHRMQVLEGIKNQKEAKHYLPQALELGMHREERIIELESGISMHLPTYLKAQCDKYNIKIPE